MKHHIQVVKLVLKALSPKRTYYKRKKQQVHKEATFESMIKQLQFKGCKNDDPPITLIKYIGQREKC